MADYCDPAACPCTTTAVFPTSWSHHLLCPHAGCGFPAGQPFTSCPHKEQCAAPIKTRSRNILKSTPSPVVIPQSHKYKHDFNLAHHSRCCCRGNNQSLPSPILYLLKSLIRTRRKTSPSFSRNRGSLASKIGLSQACAQAEMFWCG